jgi:hypothetical protein
MSQIERYGLLWDDKLQPLQIEMYMIQKGGQYTENGQTFGNGLMFHMEQMRHIIWPELDSHRWHKVCLEEQSRNKVTVFMGPGSCVAGHTRLLNPITGEQTPIRELAEKKIAPIVQTLFGPVQARIPFLKGQSELIEVKLSNGSVSVTTPGHLVLTELGFVPVSSLQIGQSLLSYAEFQAGSISGIDHLASRQDAQRWSRITPDSQADYRASHHSYDAQPQSRSTVCQGFAPLHDDVPRRNYCGGWSERPGDELEHTRPDLSSVRLSSLGVCLPGAQAQTHALSRSFSKTPSRASGSFLQLLQWQSNFDPHSAFSELNCGSIHSLKESEKPCSDDRVPVAKVTSLRSVGFGDYYDLQVPNAHHYFAEGAIHHNSGKTHEAAWFYLCLYWCDPHNTCVLVSSTDMRGLRMRAWGEMSALWQRGKDAFPWLAGHLLDSRVAITTDSLTDGDFEKRTVRDMRKGIIGIPTVQGGKKIGLGKWVGIKQKNVYLLADEAQQMGEAFLSAFANLNKNENFRATVCGNPEDALDPLGKAAEPLDGWEDHLQPEKTEVWKTRFMNGTCVNLVGMDSPNFDFPEHEPTRYKYLISREKIADTLSFFPKDSVEFYSQCWGIMKIGTMQHRVMTRDQARQWGVKTLPIWRTGPAYKVCALDAAYGGDRCVLGHADVGEDPDGSGLLPSMNPRRCQSK